MPFFIGPPPGRYPAVRSARLQGSRRRATAKQNGLLIRRRRRAELHDAGAGGSAAVDDARARPVGIHPWRNLEAGRRLRGGDGGGRQAGPCRCGAAAHRLLTVSARLHSPGGRRAAHQKMQAPALKATELAAVEPRRNRLVGTGRTRTDLCDFRLRDAHRARRAAAERKLGKPNLRRKPAALPPEAPGLSHAGGAMLPWRPQPVRRGNRPQGAWFRCGDEAWGKSGQFPETAPRNSGARRAAAAREG